MDKELLWDILSKALSHGGDFAEVFFERRESTAIAYENQKVEKINTGTDIGIGIRVVAGEATAYLHSNDLQKKNLLAMADLAGQIASKKQVQTCAALSLEKNLKPNQIILPPENVNFEDKIQLLRAADAAARNIDSCIRQTTLSYGDIRQQVIIANSLGKLVEDTRTRVRLSCNSIAVRDNQRQTGFASAGGTCGFELFEEHNSAKIGAEASQRALTLLNAIPCPTGQMPVVMGSEAGGTMVHEACGHGLEGDLVRKGLSAYAGRLGEQVASPKITVIDDATIPGKYGSYYYDDEGHLGQKNILIKDGILQKYMADAQTAAQMGWEATGNGRRESYRDKPVTRMSNTYIAPGTDSVEDIISSTEFGLYVKKMGGGQVNTLNGDYVFDVAEGYLIENGKITTPVQGATLAGNGPESLMNVEMIGNDLGYAIGTCGKYGQSAPVADAQPTMKINGLTVGGTGKPYEPKKK